VLLKINLSSTWEGRLIGFAARVRGIYATALTKILLDGGFEIAQPSSDVATRFSLKNSLMHFELDIRDRTDRQGVESLGLLDAQESFRALIRERLNDAIVRVRSSTIPESHAMDIELPSDSKKTLDEIRINIAPTVRRHHYLKACGGAVSASVDMAESLLGRGYNPQKVERTLKETIESEFPLEDDPLRIERVNLDGEITCSTGTILSLEETRLEVRIGEVPLGLKRSLGIAEVCDYAIVTTDPQRWLVDVSCYSKSQRVQGRMIYLATPPELYPYGSQPQLHPELSPLPSIRWIDLGVEAISRQNGQLEVTGLDRLIEYERRVMITEALVKTAKEKLDEALGSLRG